MKKILIASILFFYTHPLLAQITLDHVYSIPTGKTFYFTDLGNQEFKYYLIDYYNNNFSLINLDHTSYLTNIPTPVSLDSGLMTIAFISRTLFDCDSTNIEYAITTHGVSSIYKSFYVFRTDGTLLFQKDSVVTSWCFGCFGGISVEPIYNTPSGTKLTLVNLTTNDWFIYNLCGAYIQSISQPVQENQYVIIFPNPSSENLYIEVSPPSSLENYELIIYNSMLQVIHDEKIHGFKKFQINNKVFISGKYYFSFNKSNEILQSGTFILTK